MTGNVVQVFLGDDEWTSTPLGVREALRPGGRLLFETRDPARRARLGWNRDETLTLTVIPRVGAVTLPIVPATSCVRRREPRRVTSTELSTIRRWRMTRISRTGSGSCSPTNRT